MKVARPLPAAHHYAHRLPLLNQNGVFSHRLLAPDFVSQLFESQQVNWVLTRAALAHVGRSFSPSSDPADSLPQLLFLVHL